MHAVTTGMQKKSRGGRFRAPSSIKPLWVLERWNFSKSSCILKKNETETFTHTSHSKQQK